MNKNGFSHFNTTDEDGETLQDYENGSDSQEKDILMFFKANPGKLFTPHEIRFQCFRNKKDITSVRRAMSNLTRSIYLVKTKQKKSERRGRPNYLWTLPATPIQQRIEMLDQYKRIDKEV